MQGYSCHHRNCSKHYTTPYTLRRHVRLKHKQRVEVRTSPPAANPLPAVSEALLIKVDEAAIRLVLKELTRLLA